MKKKRFAVFAMAALPFTMVAACDDDNDGNVDNPDLNPGEGTGLPGEDDVDLNPGEGTGLPGEDDVDLDPGDGTGLPDDDGG